MSEALVPSKKALAIELFVLSCSSLFFELLMIRWLGCDWMPFIVFKTFPLVTCFVGLGVGVSKADSKYFNYLPVALLVATFIICVLTGLGLNGKVFPAAGVYQWNDLSAENLSNLIQTVTTLTAAVVAVLVGPFAVMFCLGNRIGAIFNQFRPLNAYCIDIAGAISGSIFFTLLCFLRASPAVEMVVFVALVFTFLYRRLPKPFAAVCCALTAIVVSFITLQSANGIKTMWTPYYCLQLIEFKIPDDVVEKGQVNTPIINLRVNHCFMQYFTPNNDLKFNPEMLKTKSLSELAELLHLRKNYYSLPYTFARPKDVLILGAGTGSDVKAAVEAGAESVDAVEIDPAVIELGHQFNPVYSSPKVHVHCTDARHYVNQCTKKYDMVIFACLDSASLAGQSSMRTDSYIHTKQSYQHCLSLLKPNGVFVVSFGAGSGNTQWLRNKIFLTIKSAAGYSPLVITDQQAPHSWPAYIFLAGEPVKQGKLIAPVSADSFTGVQMPADVQGRVITDDWPYLYVRPIGVDIPYMFVLLLVVGITVFAGRGLVFSKDNSPSDWQLFFLGAAFMLIELQSISRLSLLYGNTWLTASIVINGVLIMILAANALVFKFGSRLRPTVLYAMLLASLLVSYFLRVGDITNAAGMLGGNAIVTVLTLLPMFVAGLVFASTYAGVKTPARSFAFNLLGSVAGGLLEYASTYTGINSLVLIGVTLYVFSWICWLQRPKEAPAVAISESTPNPNP